MIHLPMLRDGGIILLCVAALTFFAANRFKKRMLEKQKQALEIAVEKKPPRR